MKQIGIKLLCAIANKINEKNNYPLPLPIAENISLKLKFIYSQEDEEYFYKYEIENSYKGLNKSCKKLLLKSKDNYDPKSEKNIILSDKGVYFYNVIVKY